MPDLRLFETTPFEKSAQLASGPLISAAIAGLIGLGAAGCGSDSNSNLDSGHSGGSHSHDTGGTSSGGSSSGGSSNGGTSSGGSGENYNDVIDEDAADMTMDEFRTLCEERGGYTYVNAACATSSMCRGLSLHDGTIWDHSCRGQNSSCSGVGCLDMPEDKGIEGQELFEASACGDCHADWSATTDWDNPIVDYKRYAVFFDPKVISEKDAMARFADSTDKRLESIIVWGVNGFHEDRTPYSNMPTYYQKYSLAEIRRVAAYIRTLTPFPHPYSIYGEPEILPPPGPSGGD